MPEKKVKFFGAQATGCSPISRAVKDGKDEIDPQKPHTIARSLAIGNPADGLYATRVIRGSGGWAEDVSDPEIVTGIETLAAAEGVFGETAAGVTVSCAQALIAQGRISPDEETVLCITGNGLKTTDALAGRMTLDEPLEPRMAAFEKFMGSSHGRFRRVISTCSSGRPLSAGDLRPSRHYAARLFRGEALFSPSTDLLHLCSGCRNLCLVGQGFSPDNKPDWKRAHPDAR